MQYYRLGLIGWPVAHSLSPWIHRKALQAFGLEGEYNLYAVDPQRFEDQAGPILQGLHDGSLDGINITVPHKRRVLGEMDRLTDAAKAAGAVNTVYREGGELVGDNTDISGFWLDLARLGWVERKVAFAHSHKVTPGDQVIVMGAGGAARAAALALGQNGWEVGLAARRIDQARQVATELNRALARPGVTPLLLNEDMLKIFGNQTSMIVNATSAGMAPQIDENPWPERLPIPTDARVYDLVYNPPQTRLLRSAQAQGAQTANGLGMLVGQALLAFQRWTGQLPSFDEILPELYQFVYSERSSKLKKPEI
jgi:shikimate dehydrogenase